MDQRGSCVRALGARRRRIGAVLLFGNGGAISTRFWCCTHPSPRTDYDWSYAPGGDCDLCALCVVAESRSVESLGARTNEIRLRRRGHAGAAVSAYSADDALVVHRVYRTLLADGRDADCIFRHCDERGAA